MPKVRRENSSIYKGVTATINKSLQRELNCPYLILKTLNVWNYYILNHWNVKDFIVILEKINSQINRRIKLLHSQCIINSLELRGKKQDTILNTKPWDNYTGLRFSLYCFWHSFVFPCVFLCYCLTFLIILFIWSCVLVQEHLYSNRINKRCFCTRIR